MSHSSLAFAGVLFKLSSQAVIFSWVKVVIQTLFSKWAVFTCHVKLQQCIYCISLYHTIPVTAGVTLCWAVLHVPAVDEGQAPAPAPSLLFWVWLLSVDVQGSRSRADEWLLDVHPSWCRCWEWAERVEWCPALLLFTRNDRGISSAAMKPQMRSGYSLNGKDNTS